MLRCVALAAKVFCLAIAPVNAATVIRAIDYEWPRDFGYVLGDVFAHRIVLMVNPPYRLLPERLPQAGRINHWLRLDPIEVEQRQNGDGLHYQLTLLYQIVNIHRDRPQLGTPTQKLYFSDGEGTLSAVIPAWQFRLAMLTADSGAALRSDHRPPPAEWYPGWRWVALSGLLLSLLALAYLYDVLPWTSRVQGPFSAAARRLRRLPAAPLSVQDYRDALAMVHRAFNETAGRTLFAEGLDKFFVEQPRFDALRQPIERFFAHSRKVHFAATAIESPSYTPQALAGLCRDCRDIERGLR